MDFDFEVDEDELVSGLVEVGALTEVGAAVIKAVKGGMSPAQAVAKARKLGARPSPLFGRSSRDTTRRAPLGFKQDSDGALSFALAATIGATTTMRAKVSREAHVDRLLIVPSAAGAVIQSIMVGDEEQVLAAGVPVELYGTIALSDTLPDNFSPLQSSLDFVVVLRNTTASAITGTIGVKASCNR